MSLSLRFCSQPASLHTFNGLTGDSEPSHAIDRHSRLASRDKKKRQDVLHTLNTSTLKLVCAIVHVMIKGDTLNERFCLKFCMRYCDSRVDRNCETVHWNIGPSLHFWGLAALMIFWTKTWRHPSLKIKDYVKGPEKKVASVMAVLRPVFGTEGN